MCRTLVIFAVACLLPLVAVAEPDPDAAPAKASVWSLAMAKVEGGIDGFHQSVSRGIVGSVKSFDRFFGEDLIDQEEGTQIRLGLKSEFRENDESSFNTYASVRLQMPQLENRVQIVFDDIIEKNEEKDIAQEVVDSQPLTGLRYIVKDEKVRYNVDVGVKLKQRPDFFLRGRASRTFPFEVWSIKPSQDIYWFREDGFGEMTQIRISRKLSHERLFRSRTYAKWEENHDGVEFAQAFSVYDRLSTRRAVRSSIYAVAPTRPVFDVEKYGIQINYRQLIHANWLYMEVAPGLEFPRERDFTATPLIEIRFEMLLGDIKDFWTD